MSILHSPLILTLRMQNFSKLKVNPLNSHGNSILKRQKHSIAYENSKYEKKDFVFTHNVK